MHCFKKRAAPEEKKFKAGKKKKNVCAISACSHQERGKKKKKGTSAAAQYMIEKGERGIYKRKKKAIVVFAPPEKGRKGDETTSDVGRRKKGKGLRFVYNPVQKGEKKLPFLIPPIMISEEERKKGGKWRAFWAARAMLRGKLPYCCEFPREFGEEKKEKERPHPIWWEKKQGAVGGSRVQPLCMARGLIFTYYVDQK